MTNNTTAPAVSRPPSFMAKAEKEREKIEAAKAKAEKAVEKEVSQQDLDEFEIRAAAITKASVRIKELVSYSEKIDKVIGDHLGLMIAKNPMGQATDLFVELETQVKALEDISDTLKARMATAREISFPERFDAEEMRTFTSSVTGHRVSRTSKIYASIPSANQEQAFAWLKQPIFFEPISDADKERIAKGEITEDDVLKPLHPYTRNPEDGSIVLIEGLNAEEVPTYGALIKPTVNASSLSSLAKELLGQGMDMPAPLFTVHTKDSVSITKGKPKA